jgi:hypothetical protein
VQHVPGTNRNLISGSLLCRDGFKLMFESNKFIVSKFGLFIGKGYDSGGLFHLSVADDCNNVANSVSYSELNVGEATIGTLDFVILVLIALFNCLGLI